MPTNNIPSESLSAVTANSPGVMYPRKWRLVVYNENKILDLSNVKFHFLISAADVETPNMMLLRIYNLSNTPEKPTAAQIRAIYTRVNLEVGYGNEPFGVIYDGQIVQVRQGRENQINTYTDILGGDGDEPYNTALLNTSLPSGANGTQAQYGVITKSMGVQTDYSPEMGGGINPRGKVLFGLARDNMRSLANTNGWSWSIQNGKLLVIPEEGYKPDKAVVLTSKTGLISLPTQTNQGIIAKCLINPKIKIGTRVQIDNASIQRAQWVLSRSNQSQLVATSQKDADSPGINGQRFATISADGIYRVLAVDHEGDSRGNVWYSTLNCLIVNPVTQQVPAGAGIQGGLPGDF